ncbi:MAG: FtsX-like permease family protein, partial [Myxococcota bacterium]
IVPADYPTAGFRHPIEDAMQLSEADRTWLDDHTEAWAQRIVAAPRAIKGRTSMRVRLIGVTDNDETLFPRDTWTVDGALPSDGQILVADTPATLLKLGVGDVVTLESRTVDGAMNAMRYEVSGVVRSGNPVIDGQNMYLPIDSADTLLAANGRVTHIATRLGNRSEATTTAFAAAAEGNLSAVDARTWQSEIAALMETNEIRQTMFDTMGLALLLMAATGIANTILMAAYERVREIGTLRSMGLQRSGIVGMFAVEGLSMGLIGGIIGASMAGAITAYYSTNGIDMMALMGAKADAMGNVPVAAYLYMDFSPATLVIAVVVGVIVAVAASIYPALMASNVSPAEAVRAA